MSDAPSDLHTLDPGPDDEDAPKPPRFPYVVAAFALVCVTCAAWLWMRYSYAWPATPADLAQCDAVWVGRYVRLEGRLAEGEHELMAHFEDVDGGPGTLVMLGEERTLAGGATVSVTGRVIDASYSPQLGKPPALRMLGVNGAMSRLHPASVSGLVVAAMGVFVLALYLRRWLACRREFDAPAPRP